MTPPAELRNDIPDKDYSKYGFHDPEKYVFKSKKGLDEEVVRMISRMKKEPEWMLRFRLRALKHFQERPMPKWGANLSTINFDDIYYYINAAEKNSQRWEDVPETIKNTFEKLGIPEAERKFLGGVGAQYECLTGDTKVFTNPSGPKDIKSVKVGDKVFALDEATDEIKPSVVKSIMFKGEREVFEVKIGTRKIKSTINHPFLALVNNKKNGARRGSYKKEWRYLSDLKVGDLVAVVKQIPHEGNPYELPQAEDASYRHNKIKIPEYTDQDFMWFLGLYLGDGFIHKEKVKARVEIAIPKSDAQLRKELVNVIENVFDIKASEIDADRVTIYSTILAKFIEQIGFGGKAKTKKVPEWVFSLPKSQILAFLAGYLDSDGYVRDSKKNHDIAFTSVNKQILEDIIMLVILCGLSTSEIHEFKSKHVHDKERMMTGYRLQVSGNIDIIPSRSENRFLRFGKKKYHHKFNSAKNTSFKKHANDFFGFAKIESIKPVGVEPVYDIEVEDHHNFVAEGIIVHNSEVVYHKIREDLEKKGVIFLGMDQGLQEHPEIVKKFFNTIVPFSDNKIAALNTAVWSGGSFIYVPKGVKVDLPLQAYFRINAQNAGQFERTLIIADEDSFVHYIEGCTAPTYASDSLHAAVVELIAMPGSRLRYTTIQNWSSNVYNLVTKRAFAYENATVEWIDGNLGSKITMKYPSIYLLGEGAKGEILSVAYAGKGQHQDAGGKIIHMAKNTTSTILSKSISKDGGRTTYRGLLKVAPGATNVKSNVRCDALILDEHSSSDTIPYMEIEEKSVSIGHEAVVGKISEEQLFYLMSRGLKEQEAMSMIVCGFIEPFTKELPLEYAVELNRLIQLEMIGAIG